MSSGTSAKVYEKDRTLENWAWDMDRRAENARKLRGHAPSAEVAEYLLGRATAFEEASRVLRQASYVERDQ